MAKHGILSPRPVVAAFEEEQAGISEEERTDDNELRRRAEPIEEELWERVGNEAALTVSELREHLAWVAEQGGMQHAMGVDGEVAYIPLEALVETLHTVLQGKVLKLEKQAQKVEKRLLKERRARILPDAESLEKVRRYEAHLSRELYRALHSWRRFRSAAEATRLLYGASTCLPLRAGFASLAALHNEIKCEGLQGLAQLLRTLLLLSRGWVNRGPSRQEPWEGTLGLALLGADGGGRSNVVYFPASAPRRYTIQPRRV